MEYCCVRTSIGPFLSQLLGLCPIGAPSAYRTGREGNCSELYTRRVPFSLHVLFVGVTGFSGAQGFVQGLVPLFPTCSVGVCWILFRSVQLSSPSLNCRFLGLVPPSSGCLPHKTMSAHRPTYRPLCRSPPTTDKSRFPLSSNSPSIKSRPVAEGWIIRHPEFASLSPSRSLPPNIDHSCRIFCSIYYSFAHGAHSPPGCATRLHISVVSIPISVQ